MTKPRKRSTWRENWIPWPSELPARQLDLWALLWLNADRQNVIPIDVPAIADALKLGRSTVRRYLAELKRLGLVRVEKRTATLALDRAQVVRDFNRLGTATSYPGFSGKPAKLERPFTAFPIKVLGYREEPS